MSPTARPRPTSIAALLATSIAASALAQSGTIRVVPAQPIRLQPATAAAAAPEPPAMSAEEVAQVRAQYDALPPEEQEEMVAFYSELGIDLLALFGLEGATPGPVGAAAGADVPLLPLVQQKDFKRTPQTVLAARTRLGLQRVARPEADASPAELATWLHDQVMAGEWDSLEWFLAERAGDNADAIYAHVVQSTNQGDPLLLPEEVLALADAAPSAPADWQLDALAQLLATSAEKSSTGPMLARLRAGTRLFGDGDAERRRRTASLLMQAGMPLEAYAYLPSLEAARAEADAEVILGHGRYHLGRMADVRGAAVEGERRRAFELFAEVVLLPRPEAPEPAAAEPAAPAVPVPGAGPAESSDPRAAFDAARREALDLAMDMLPDIPESIAGPWLESVFRREALAPAALELVALDAMTLSDRNLDPSQRARAVLIMKTAVDSLLASDRVDREALRIPLRMLTTGLVTEAEEVADARPDRRRGNPQREQAMLLRALPGPRWFESLEPSLAVRVYRAFVSVATVADETDLALDILERGVRAHPGQARDLARAFLGRWADRLRPSAGSDQNAAMQAAFIIFGGRTSVPAAPLTRGRQARNLERLARVLGLLEEMGADALALPETVEAFRACHSAAEAFDAGDIERVLGPIDALPGPTAAALAEAMRAGLSGDWRNRETQQRFGFRRNAAEIAEVVAEGYATAMRLIDRAIADAPESWSHAVTRAALAFDRLEHRRSRQGEDFAEYEELRRQSFEAFADAAARYADLAAAGGIPVTIDVHLAWFNAAVGATQLDQLTRDNILYEGSERDTQIDRIHDALLAMRPDQAEAHVAAFVEAITGAMTSVNPEVKPRLVRHALRVVGDDPLGAPLRRIAGVYDDLVENEIALRTVIDGADQVGAGRPFGLVLSLRYTNAVDRETDGFAKYLRNQVWVYFGNTGRMVDYRDRLERSIERSLEESFDVESVAFFDPLFPSREVRENGESGWQEKPLAYVVVRAKDPSLERVPPVRMDLDFIDTTGPVILAIESNAPALDAAQPAARRPVRDLQVTQTLDARGPSSDRAADELVLEVRATGRGVLPELEDLLAGLADAAAGWRIPENGIEVHPINVLADGELADDPFGLAAMRVDDDEEDAAPMGPDADGTYRRTFERAWTVRWVPDGAAARAGAFTLPVLAEGVVGTLESRAFDDLDIVTVSDRTVAIGGGGPSATFVATLVGLGLVAIAAIVMLVRRRPAVTETNELDGLMPGHLTPLSVVAALERLLHEHGPRLGDGPRAELQAELAGLERRWFGPGGEGGALDEAEATRLLTRWIDAAQRR